MGIDKVGIDKVGIDEVGRYPWFCQVSSIDSEQANEIVQRHTSVDTRNSATSSRYNHSLIQKSRLLTQHNQGSAQ